MPSKGDAYTNGTLGSMQGAVSYTYDSAWKDKLVWMNGQTITYDEIGNPLSYIGGLSFTWQNGRQLATATKSGVTSSYTYNVNGIRTSKTVGEDTTEYFLEGSTIISENRSDGIKLEYFFDGEGTRIGFYAIGIFSLDDPAAYVFYYVYNLQGDVIAITNNTGAIVAKYTYDAYGKPLGVTDANGNDISGNPTYVSNLNPFRYRGYFYDVDTGLYYLNSRYYDPDMGRFINSDGYVSTGTGLMGYNMFVYCNNNPVMMVDNNGSRCIKNDANESVSEMLKGLETTKLIQYALGRAPMEETPPPPPPDIIRPTQGGVTSGFNLTRVSPITGKISPHKGTDYGWGNGTELIAAISGTLVINNYNEYGGYSVTITNDKYIVKYSHLKKSSLPWDLNNTYVEQGQYIAEMGSSGKVTGVHLHFAVIDANTKDYLDPEKLY